MISKFISFLFAICSTIKTEADTEHKHGDLVTLSRIILLKHVDWVCRHGDVLELISH